MYRNWTIKPYCIGFPDEITIFFRCFSDLLGGRPKVFSRGACASHLIPSNMAHLGATTRVRKEKTIRLHVGYGRALKTAPLRAR